MWIRLQKRTIYLCVLGFSEQHEEAGQEKLMEFMEKFFFHELLYFPSDFQLLIEPPYWISGIPSNTNKLSPVIVQFLRGSVRDHLLQLARQKQDLCWSPIKSWIMLYPDYTKDVSMQICHHCYILLLLYEYFFLFKFYLVAGFWGLSPCFFSVFIVEIKNKTNKNKTFIHSSIHLLDLVCCPPPKGSFPRTTSLSLTPLHSLLAQTTDPGEYSQVIWTHLSACLIIVGSTVTPRHASIVSKSSTATMSFFSFLKTCQAFRRAVENARTQEVSSWWTTKKPLI